MLLRFASACKRARGMHLHKQRKIQRPSHSEWARPPPLSSLRLAASNPTAAFTCPTRLDFLVQFICYKVYLEVFGRVYMQRIPFLRNHLSARLCRTRQSSIVTASRRRRTAVMAHKTQEPVITKMSELPVEDARWITGQTLNVDAGMVRH